MNYRISCRNCNVVSINGIATHEQGCHGNLIYTSPKGKQFVYYTVWSLDAWGNEKDGFEVNDRGRRERIFVEYDNDMSLIKTMKQANLLNKKAHFRSFYVHGDEKTLYVDINKTREPLYELESE